MDILKTIHVATTESAAEPEVNAPVITRCGLTFEPYTADDQNVVVSEFADAESYDGVTECPRCFQRCAECETLMTDAEPISAFVCNACADPQPSEDDITIQDGAWNDARDHVFQNGRELFACFADVTYARIRAHMENAGFYPDVWKISDHGNASRVTAFMYEDQPSDPNRPIYVASYHWRDCDTLGTILGTDRAAVETALNEAITEEWDRANEDRETEPLEFDPDLDIRHIGPIAETLRSVIDNVIGSGRDADETLTDLLVHGIAYC